MQKRRLFSLCALLAMPWAVTAASLDVSLEIPQVESPKYHRPYVAVWLETFDQKHAANLAVWYKIKAPNNKGAKWLPDLRNWWRRSGQDVDLPIDGVTGATRGPGLHTLHFDSDSAILKDLKPGKYYLSVESAREEGKEDVRHERLLISFTWPPQKIEQRQAMGKTELGSVSLQLAP